MAKKYKGLLNDYMYIVHCTWEYNRIKTLSCTVYIYRKTELYCILYKYIYSIRTYLLSSVVNGP